MILDLKKNIIPDPGFHGLPEEYPTPPYSKDLLFYIQRNQNKNTVVYELNRNKDGNINIHVPMHAYWIRYTDGGEIVELNYIQNKLAFGYESKMICSDAFEFNFVSYKEMKFYIGKTSEESYGVFCRLNNKMSILNNIYVYAEELGVFPNVKFIELYGKDLETDMFCYQKINLEA